MTKEEATGKIIEFKNSMIDAKGVGVKAFQKECTQTIDMISRFKYNENDEIFRLFVASLDQKRKELNERLQKGDG